MKILSYRSGLQVFNENFSPPVRTVEQEIRLSKSTVQLFYCLYGR
jgi:hypothetical protein